MRERLGLHRHSLTVQMILSYVALALLTAVATGLPAIWLIHNQIERQAWTQVEQGSRAAQALYLGWQGKIADLATLTSQRPTLQTLLAQGAVNDLPVYLQTLRAGTELDLLAVCDGKNLAAHAGTAVPANICALTLTTNFYMLNDTVWLLAAQKIGNETDSWGQVVAGIALDETFARQMHDQTGLEHTLLQDGRPLVSSLPALPSGDCCAADPPVTTGIMDAATFEQGNRSYYAARISLDPVSPAAALHLADQVALDVTDIVATQKRLIWILSVSIGLVALVGSALGLILARRISHPLARLADAAVTFQLGDLNQPVSIRSGIYEVSLTAEALEQARAELERVITELRQAKAWSDHLLEAIVEGIVTLDADGRITFFSPGAERIAGQRQEKALGRHTDEIFPLADALFSQSIPLPGKRHKVALQLPDGQQKTVAITAARISPPAARESGVVMVLRDVTETEIMHRLLGEFLANITHEFRTPLTALAVSVELLCDQAPDLSQSEMQELLASLHLGVLGLQTLIGNLLESARLEAGHFRVQPHPADLGQIIAEAIEIMRPLQVKYNQRLVVELPTAVPTVQADARRVEQVLVNLLSNAIRHNPDGAEILIQATLENGQARIAVADEGPGVPDERRAELFRPFTHPRQSGGAGHHGVGLGLLVVKAIVEAHGGAVAVADRPEGGAVFAFTLPLAKN